MSDGAVRYRTDGQVAVITLDRPDKHNALSVAMLDQLAEAWTRFETSDERCAIITGAGDRAFCAGLELGAVLQDPRPYWRAFPMIGVPLSKIVIAAVAGHCIGGGWSLVQHSDLAVATDYSTFLLPEAQLGVYGGLTSSLARHVAKKAAVEFQLLGRPITAQRAEQLGLINRVTAPGQHLAVALEWASRIADASPAVVGAVKSYSDAATTGPFESYAKEYRRLADIVTRRALDATRPNPPDGHES